MNKVKNILILAGGDSTRFWPLKEKTLFSFMGKSVLEHILAAVSPHGEKIIVVTNEENNPSIKKIKSIHETVIQKDVASGMAGAILASRDIVKGDLLILNGNDLFDPAILTALLRDVAEKDIDLAFVAKKTHSYFPGGYLAFNPEGQLMGIIEKPDPRRTPSDLTNLVVDYFKDSDKLISILEQVRSEKDDLFEIALTEFIKKHKTHYIVYENFWYTLKYPWHVLPMMSHFLSSLGNEVRLGKNVKISNTAKVVGPCVIGDNTVIGDFALVRQSHIGKNCIVGSHTEVARSYLGDHVFLHRNYIGDSVLATDVLMGAEATTANFRFDEKSVNSLVKNKKIDTQLVKLGAMIGTGSKIGVNTTLLPGIKIGSHTYIAPGYTIAEDVADGMFVRKNGVKNNIRENRQ